MSEQDHFSNVLDVEAHEEPHEPHFGAADYAGADEYGEFGKEQTQVQVPKKAVPKLLLIAGGMAVFVVLGVGYQYFFGAKHQSAANNNMNASADAIDTGTGGNPATGVPPLPQGGMLAHGPATPPPLPAAMNPSASNAFVAGPAVGGLQPTASGAINGATAQPAATPGAATTSSPPSVFDAAQTPAAPTGVSTSQAAAPAAVPTSATGMMASADANAPASSANVGEAASAQPAAATPAAIGGANAASDPKDLEIAKLQAELKAARGHHEKTQRHAGKHATRIAHTHLRANTNTVAAASDANAASGTDAASGASASASSDANANTNASGSAMIQAASGADAASAPRTAKGAANRHHPRHAARGKHARVEVLVGYHIKQVVPGQGWIEDEQTGKQQVVAVGDKIGRAEVIKIDPDNYRIDTTAGVIQ
ncbi:hypothetical protein [Trinickia fusca]|uniref:Uncharacterized protein n=1 Tax=Trinickia fusca TaxID=2419777 RepID=A0A494XAP7_9BURK|nr:hypothetical protein [Trinickia fusca]RKP47580.1 hypothetical protein D7S89_15245 [Trinickia fusca]